MILPIGRRLSRAGYTLLEIRKFLTGYTLIELILLAAIILIIVAISTPQFRNTFSDLEIKNASFNISKLIRFAHEKSIIERAPYRLILNTDEGRYYLMKLNSDSASGKYIRLKERFGRTFSIPRGIKLKADKKQINFYPDGHSDKAVITLSDKQKHLKITVKGNLGYVEIEQKP